MQTIRDYAAIFIVTAVGACAPARSAPSGASAAQSPASTATASVAQLPPGDAAGNGGQSTTKGGMPGGMMGGMCPMQVAGTTLSATDVDGGVELSFTRRTGDVNDLRQRVRRMAEMHYHMSEMHGRQGPMMMGGADGGAGAGKGMTMRGCMMGETRMPAASASVEDLEGGARLILRPRDPADLDALRKHARECAERMKSGTCPMMGSSAMVASETPPAVEK